MQPWRCVLKIVLAGGLAFPLAAQPVSPPETPVGQSELGGVLEHMRLSNGAKVVFQSDPNLPVVAVTLVQPWGSADDPANLPGLTRELARSVSRTSTSLPGGALLVRLNRIGGRTSFFCGRRWTSWTLVVPKHYADWAVQIQLERLNGPSLRGEDLEGSGAGSGRVELELFSRQHWDPQRATLAVTGGYNATSVLSRLQRAQLPQPPAPPSAATASTPGFGKGLLYTEPLLPPPSGLRPSTGNSSWAWTATRPTKGCCSTSRTPACWQLRPAPPSGRNCAPAGCASGTTWAHARAGSAWRPPATAWGWESTSRKSFANYPPSGN